MTSLIALTTFKETYGPVLQQKRVASVEKGTALSPSPQDRRKAFTLAWIRPLKLLFLSPIILVLGLYLAIMNSYAQICFATIGTVFQDRYGFSPGRSGMAYFGLTTGFLASQISLGYFSDRYIKRMSAKHENITPEHRLPPIFIGALTLPIGLLWYGWSLQERSHWILPIVGSAFIAVGILST